MTSHPEILRDLAAVKTKLSTIEAELATVRANQRPGVSRATQLSIQDLAAVLRVTTGAVRKAHKAGRIYRLDKAEWGPTVVGTRLYYEKLDPSRKGGDQ